MNWSNRVAPVHENEDRTASGWLATVTVVGALVVDCPGVGGHALDRVGAVGDVGGVPGAQRLMVCSSRKPNHLVVVHSQPRLILL